MRYRDNNFLRHQERQRDGMELESKTVRQERRADRKAKRAFYAEVLSPIGIDSDWWEFLPDDQKSSVMWSHRNSLNKGIGLNLWSNFKVFYSMEEWKAYILGEFKPDMAAMRQARLRKIGV